MVNPCGAPRIGRFKLVRSRALLATVYLQAFHAAAAACGRVIISRNVTVDGQREDVADPPASAPGPEPHQRAESDLPSIRWFVLFGLASAALLLRLPGISYESGDYVSYFAPWMSYIRDNGGFWALSDPFANYNVPYLYLLVLISYAPDPLIALKLVSIVFDVILAWWVYRLLRLRYSTETVPALGAVGVLLLPTVATNSAVWGQCDSIYASFALAGVYYLMRDRPWLACAMLGVSYAFKQQALFVFPVLVFLVLARRVPWPCLLAIPAVFLALDVPALIAGRPLADLLTIYSDQVDTYEYLTLNASSIYQFLPVSANAEIARSFGIIFTGVLALLLVYIALATRVQVTPLRILLFAVTSAILMPFFLPAMHDRYFYIADVLSVVAALWLPRRLWFVPIAVQLGSFIGYVFFLFGPGVVVGPGRPDQQVGAVLMLVALALCVRAFGQEFEISRLSRQSGSAASDP